MLFWGLRAYPLASDICSFISRKDEERVQGTKYVWLVCFTRIDLRSVGLECETNSSSEHREEQSPFHSAQHSDSVRSIHKVSSKPSTIISRIPSIITWKVLETRHVGQYGLQMQPIRHNSGLNKTVINSIPTSSRDTTRTLTHIGWTAADIV